jgi:flagellar secretion chaperone FliS
MSIKDPYAQYLENQIMTATPGKLLILTYDGAIKFARLALDGIRKYKLDEKSFNIGKVQNILIELMSTLNHDVDQQFAANLDALYTYMFDQLTAANLNDNIQILEEVIQILTDLRAAWMEAEMSARTGKAPSSTQEALAA